MKTIWPYLFIGMLTCLLPILFVLDISYLKEWSFGLVFIGLTVITKDIYDLRVALQQKDDDLRQLKQEMDDVTNNSKLSSDKKTKYLAKVSHDLRTPLHGINGIIDMIDKETISPKVQRYLEQIKHSSKALMSVIAGVIDLSDDESTDVLLEPAPFKLIDVCENVIRIFIQSAYEKQLSIQLHFDPKLLNVRVYSDERRLQQVLTNLIGNAFKFTESGSVSLWVMTRSDSNDNAEIRFMVVDTGIGIPEKELKSIFDPYYQVESRQNLKIKGSGLGLNISQELIAKFGGTLRVSSTVDIGSKFFFDLIMQKAQSHNIDKLILNTSSYQDHVVCVTNKNTTTESLTQLFRHYDVDTVQCETLESILNYQFHSQPRLLILELSIINDIEQAQIIQDHVRAQSNYLLVDNFDLESFDNWQILNKPILPSDILKLCVASDILRSIKTTNSLDSNAKEQAKLYFQHQPFKLLIVDDVEINQIILHELVKQLDIVDCDFACNGLEAVEMAMSRHYDLILMDMHMPVMSGGEASAKISEARPEITIIAVTATVDKEINMVLKGGIHSVLRKPLTLECLSQHLYKYFVKAVVSKKEQDIALTQFNRTGIFDAVSQPVNILVSTSHVKIAEYLDTLSHILNGSINIQYAMNNSNIEQIIQLQGFQAIILDEDIEIQILLKQLQRKRLMIPILIISDLTKKNIILPSHVTMINKNIEFNKLCDILSNQLTTTHHSNSQLSIQNNENIKL